MTLFRISILWLARGSSLLLIVSVTKCMFAPLRLPGTNDVRFWRRLVNPQNMQTVSSNRTSSNMYVVETLCYHKETEEFVNAAIQLLYRPAKSLSLSTTHPLLLNFTISTDGRNWVDIHYHRRWNGSGNDIQWSLGYPLCMQQVKKAK